MSDNKYCGHKNIQKDSYSAYSQQYLSIPVSAKVNRRRRPALRAPHTALDQSTLFEASATPYTDFNRVIHC